MAKEKKEEKKKEITLPENIVKTNHEFLFSVNPSLFVFEQSFFQIHQNQVLSSHLTL